MIEKLKKIYLSEMFNPKLLGLFSNPFYIIRRGLYKSIKKHSLKLDGKLLDFGCGSKPYRKLFEVSQYVGLDIEESGHDNSNEDIDVNYDGKTIPFEDNYFDSVFTSEVFEHIFNLDEILTELNRVCKIDAKLLITIPFVWDEHEIPYDFARYTSFGIKHLLERHGFEIIELEKTTTYVQTVFQMWNAYVFQHVLKSGIIAVLFTPILITPVTIIGQILSFVLPKNENYYHNNVVLAKKISNDKSIK